MRTPATLSSHMSSPAVEYLSTWSTVTVASFGSVADLHFVDKAPPISSGMFSPDAPRQRMLAHPSFDESSDRGIAGSEVVLGLVRHQILRTCVVECRGTQGLPDAANTDAEGSPVVSKRTPTNESPQVEAPAVI